METTFYNDFQVVTGKIFTYLKTNKDILPDFRDCRFHEEGLRFSSMQILKQILSDSLPWLSERPGRNPHLPFGKSVTSQDRIYPPANCAVLLTCFSLRSLNGFDPFQFLLFYVNQPPIKSIMKKGVYK